jgi:hypothetical protein
MGLGRSGEVVLSAAFLDDCGAELIRAYRALRDHEGTQ